jgi:hypothetical protein
MPWRRDYQEVTRQTTKRKVCGSKKNEKKFGGIKIIN